MILGIDQWLTATGFAYYPVTEGLRLETMKTPKKDYDNTWDRLMDIRLHVRAILRRDRPALVVMEGYNYGVVRQKNMAGRAFDLGELGAVIKQTVYNEARPLVIVPPSVLKQFATGNGNAEKAQMIETAVAAGADPQNDNEADAFWLMRLGEVISSGRLRAHQRALLDKVRWEFKEF